MREEVTFRFVDNSDAHLNELYPSFKVDFLNPNCHVPDLKQKYDLSASKYKYLREKVLKETGLKEKPTLRGGRNYTITDKRYIIQHKHGKCTIYKTIDGYKKSFGTYPDLETAQLVRDRLVECEWDEVVALELKKEYS